MVIRALAATAMVLLTAGPTAAGELSDLVQADRMTVLEVNKPAHKVRCIERSWMSVAAAVTVVGHEGHRIDLTELSAGDVIKVEAKGGQIEKIVVLRRASDEAGSPER